MAHQVGAYPDFTSLKQGYGLLLKATRGIFTPIPSFPLDEMLVRRLVTPHNYIRQYPCIYTPR